ncbi:MAG TPA: hypothetical protein VM582_07455 [Candidatus Thermoplasmatota archaeon]|nr:hypothetical protein [Candidatus Thermoplasmatota archaeon]
MDLVTASYVANAVAGLAYVIVGVALLALRPARQGAAAFAAFALVAGAQHLLGNLGALLAGTPQGPWLSMATYPFRLVAPFWIVWATLRYHRGASLAWLAPFALVAAGGALVMAARPEALFGPDGFETPLGHFVISMPYFLGIAFAGVLLSRAQQRQASPRLRMEGLLLLFALLPYLAYTAGLLLPLVLRWDYDRAVIAGYAATFGLCLAVVLWSSARLWRAGSRGARALAVVQVALAGVGLAQSLLIAQWALFGGVLRFAAALALGYALLKYRIFDIDLRVKTGLARGLVAGVAVGGFFLASELAEGFVADRTGSALMGLAAAGVLLLVETRVTHMGRRLADRALPRVEPTRDYLDTRRLNVYRAALESAERDEVLTPRERQMLDALARELRLTSEERGAVEREARHRLAAPAA